MRQDFLVDYIERRRYNCGAVSCSIIIEINLIFEME